MEAISRTKRLLPQKRKNQKIREPLVLKGSLEIICDSSIKLRRMYYWDEEKEKKKRESIQVSVVVRRMYYWDSHCCPDKNFH